MAGIVEGKKILIMGLRNKWSIAWGITKKLYEGGAELAFTYMGDREEAGVRSLLKSLSEDDGDGGEAAGGAADGDSAATGGTVGGATNDSEARTSGGDSAAAGGASIAATNDSSASVTNEGSAAAGNAAASTPDFPLIKCDLGSDAETDAAFAELKSIWGGLDGVVHAVAHAFTEDLQNDFILTSREGFLHALDISAYSLVCVAKRASELMASSGGSILTLTYMGSERVFPGYNVMGVAKAALEATVRYLAHSLGPKGVRVNAISSGAIKTLSSKAVKNFSNMMSVVDEKAPLKRGVSADEVGGSALYLMSDLSSAVTGEIHYVDCGFNIMGT